MRLEGVGVGGGVYGCEEAMRVGDIGILDLHWRE